MMRLRIIIGLGLIFLSGSLSFGQNVVPPPGFSPGAVDDSSVLPPPVTSPSTPRTYSGTGTSAAGGVYSGSSDSAVPYRYPNTVQNRPGPQASDRSRFFPSPAAPLMVFDEDEPAMPRVWFRAEALWWWSKSSPLPVPLVTQGSLADTVPGALGQPGTSVILGNENVRLPSQSGARFTFGFTFDPEQTWGAEVTYFSLSTASVTQGVYSNGNPASAFLAFPFYDPTTQSESSSPVSLPGAFAGNARITTQSVLRGTEVSLLHNVMNNQGLRLDLLGGFRYVNLQESMNFVTDSPNVFPNPPAFFHTFDSFNTTNNFYGAQFGLRASYDSAIFFANATTKLALGDTFEHVSINGGTFTNAGGGFSSAPGAYLSQPSNMGSQTRNQFGVVPEFDLNFGVRLRPWASIIVGYSFMYLSSVARPGNQMDRTINPSQSSAITNNFPATLSGPANPFLSVHNTDFWAQGLNLALELRF